jgi:hypothetical protein
VRTYADEKTMHKRTFTGAAGVSPPQKFSAVGERLLGNYRTAEQQCHTSARHGCRRANVVRNVLETRL